MKNRHLKSTFVIVAALLANLFAMQSSQGANRAGPEIAAIPRAFSYQGSLRLADGSLPTGSFSVTLKIYNVVTGGAALHSETFANTPVRIGNFSVVVGDAAPIAATVFDNASLFLGITVAPDAEMLPRQRLFPVPWALQASAAQTAVSATTAQTASTLAQNATGNGLTLNGGGANTPGITLNSSGPGWGSGMYFVNLTGNVTWGQYAGADGNFHVLNVGGSQEHMRMVNGGDTEFLRTVSVKAGLNANTLYSFGNIGAAGKIYAAQGFSGWCTAGAFNQGVVGNNLNVLCNQDVAETFATDQRTEAGDLVIFAPGATEIAGVKLSSQSYERAIVGVVSTNPGLVFDQGKTYLAGDNANLITDKKTVVAMIGRVPAKFSLENGPIAVGDPLTSGSAPGTAMKATQAGQIIGYAMQSSATAKGGKILTWLQPGMYIPQDTLAALNALTAHKAGQ